MMDFLSTSKSKPSKDSVLVAFGQSVLARRVALELSQEELAARAGLHRTYIGDIERGTRNVALRNIVLLAQALETTPDLFFKAIRPASAGRQKR